MYKKHIIEILNWVNRETEESHPMRILLSKWQTRELFSANIPHIVETAVSIVDLIRKHYPESATIWQEIQQAMEKDWLPFGTYPAELESFYYPKKKLAEEETPAPVSPLDIQIAGDHYKKLSIQPVEYIQANKIPFMEGSAIKYLTRWRDKGGIEDLKKAKHFIDMLIEFEEKQNAHKTGA